MKIKAAEHRVTLERYCQKVRLWLFYGPDDAGCAALSKATQEAMAGDAEKVEISGADLKSDPGRLSDEAASLSLFGDARVVLVTGQGEECHKAFEMLLEADNAINPVVAVMGGLTDRSRTAKLVAGHDDAVACISYIPELRDMTPMILQMGRDSGLDLQRHHAETIARYTQMDRRLAAMEIEKLALYCDARPDSPPKPVDDKVLASLAAQTDDDAMAPIVHAVLAGEVQHLPEHLQLVANGNVNSVVLLLALQRRMVLLGKLRKAMADGQSVDGAIKAERVFWKEANLVKMELSVWSVKRLARLSERLIGLHTNIMQSSALGHSLLMQELTDIAIAVARMRAKRR